MTSSFDPFSILWQPAPDERNPVIDQYVDGDSRLGEDGSGWEVSYWQEANPEVDRGGQEFYKRGQNPSLSTPFALLNETMLPGRPFDSPTLATALYSDPVRDLLNRQPGASLVSQAQDAFARDPSSPMEQNRESVRHHLYWQQKSLRLELERKADLQAQQRGSVVQEARGLAERIPSSRRDDRDRPVGFLSRPRLSDYKAMFAQGSYLGASYFQMENLEVVASLPEKYDVAVALPTRIFSPTPVLHYPSHAQGYDYEAQAFSQAQIHGGTLMAATVMDDPQNDRRVHGKLAPLSFHPKVGYVEDQDGKVTMAWIGTQNLTEALERNRTMENVLVFRGRQHEKWVTSNRAPERAFEDVMAQEIKTATRILLDLGERLDDKHKIIVPGQFSQRLHKAGVRHLVADQDIIFEMADLLRRAAEPTIRVIGSGAKKDKFSLQHIPAPDTQVVISTWQISLLTRSTPRNNKSMVVRDIKKYLRTLAKQGRLTVLLDKGTFDELYGVYQQAKSGQSAAKALYRQGYHVAFITDLIESGAFYRAPSSFHHEKSLFVFNKDFTQLEELMTGSANITRQSMLPISEQSQKVQKATRELYRRALGRDLTDEEMEGTLETELNVFLRRDGDKGESAYLDMITPQVLQHLEYNLNYRAKQGYIHHDLADSQQVLALKSKIETLKTQLHDSGVKIQVQERWSQPKWRSGKTDRRLVGLRLTVESGMGVQGYSTSLEVTVGADGTVILPSRNQVLPGSVYFNRSSFARIVPGSPGEVITPGTSRVFDSQQTLLAVLAGLGAAMNEQAAGTLIMPVFLKQFAPVGVGTTARFLRAAYNSRRGTTIDDFLYDLARGEYTNAKQFYGRDLTPSEVTARLEGLANLRTKLLGQRIPLRRFLDTAETLLEVVSNSKPGLYTDIMYYLLNQTPLKDSLRATVRSQVREIEQLVLLGALEQNNTLYGYAQVAHRLSVIGTTVDDTLPSLGGLAMFNPLPMRATGGMGIGSQGRFLRLIGAQGYRGKATLGGLRSISMTVSSLDEENIAFYDFPALAQKMPQLDYLTKETLKERYQSVLNLLGSQEELDESSEVFQVFGGQPGLYFFMLPSGKVEQFLQRFKNLMGARQANEVNPALYLALLRGQATNLPTDEGDIYSDQLRRVMAPGAYLRFQQMVQKHGGDVQAALRELRRIDSSPFSAEKGVLAPSVKRIEMVAGKHPMTDFYYLNESLRISGAYGFSGVMQLRIQPQQLENRAEVITRLENILAHPMLLISRAQPLPMRSDLVQAFYRHFNLSPHATYQEVEAKLAEARGSSDPYEFALGSALAVNRGKAGSLNFTLRSGLYSLQPSEAGKEIWLHVGSFTKDGRVMVAAGRTTSPGGRQYYEPIYITNRAFNLRYQNAIAYYHGDLAREEDPITGRITFTKKYTIMALPTSGIRGFDLFKGPGVFLKEEYFKQQFGPRSDVYAVATTTHFKSYSFTTAHHVLTTDLNSLSKLTGQELAFLLYPVFGTKNDAAVQAYLEAAQNYRGMTPMGLATLFNIASRFQNYAQDPQNVRATGNRNLAVSLIGLNVLLNDPAAAARAMQHGTIDPVAELIVRALRDPTAAETLRLGYQRLLRHFTSNPLNRQAVNLGDPNIRALLALVDVIDTQRQAIAKITLPRTRVVVGDAHLIPKDVDQLDERTKDAYDFIRAAEGFGGYRPNEYHSEDLWFISEKPSTVPYDERSRQARELLDVFTKNEPRLKVKYSNKITQAGLVTTNIDFLTGQLNYIQLRLRPSRSLRPEHFHFFEANVLASNMSEEAVAAQALRTQVHELIHVIQVLHSEHTTIRRWKAPSALSKRKVEIFNDYYLFAYMAEKESTRLSVFTLLNTYDSDHIPIELEAYAFQDEYESFREFAELYFSTPQAQRGELLNPKSALFRQHQDKLGFVKKIHETRRQYGGQWTLLTSFLAEATREVYQKTSYARHEAYGANVKLMVKAEYALEKFLGSKRGKSYIQGLLKDVFGSDFDAESLYQSSTDLLTQNRKILRTIYGYADLMLRESTYVINKKEFQRYARAMVMVNPFTHALAYVMSKGLQPGEENRLMAVLSIMADREILRQVNGEAWRLGILLMGRVENFEKVYKMNVDIGKSQEVQDKFFYTVFPSKLSRTITTQPTTKTQGFPSYDIPSSEPPGFSTPVEGKKGKEPTPGSGGIKVLPPAGWLPPSPYRTAESFQEAYLTDMSYERAIGLYSNFKEWFIKQVKTQFNDQIRLRDSLGRVVYKAGTDLMDVQIDLFSSLNNQVRDAVLAQIGDLPLNAYAELAVRVITHETVHALQGLKRRAGQRRPRVLSGRRQQDARHLVPKMTRTEEGLQGLIQAVTTTEPEYWEHEIEATALQSRPEEVLNLANLYAEHTPEELEEFTDPTSELYRQHANAPEFALQRELVEGRESYKNSVTEQMTNDAFLMWKSHRKARRDAVIDSIQKIRGVWGFLKPHLKPIIDGATAGVSFVSKTVSSVIGGIQSFLERTIFSLQLSFSKNWDLFKTSRAYARRVATQRRSMVWDLFHAGLAFRIGQSSNWLRTAKDTFAANLVYQLGNIRNKVSSAKERFSTLSYWITHDSILSRRLAEGLNRLAEYFSKPSRSTLIRPRLARRNTRRFFRNLGEYTTEQAPHIVQSLGGLLNSLLWRENDSIITKAKTEGSSWLDNFRTKVTEGPRNIMSSLREGADSAVAQWWSGFTTAATTSSANIVSAVRQIEPLVADFFTNTVPQGLNIFTRVVGSGYENTVSALRQGGAAVGNFFTNTVPQGWNTFLTAASIGSANVMSSLRQVGRSLSGFFTNTLPDWRSVSSKSVLKAVIIGLGIISPLILVGASPKVLLGAAILGLGLIYSPQIVARANDFFTNTIPQWRTAFSAAVDRGYENTVSTLRQVGARVGNFFTNTIPQWRDALSGAVVTGYGNTISALRQVGNRVGNFFTNTIPQWWNASSGALARGYGNTVSAFRQAGTSVANFFTNTIPQWWGELSEALATGYGNTVSVLRQASSAVGNFLTDTIPQWWNALSGAVATGYENTISAFRQAGTSVANFFTNTIPQWWGELSEALATGYGNTVSVLRQAGTAVGSFFTNTIPQWWGALSGAVATGYGNAVSAFRKASTSVANFFTNTIPQWWNALSEALATGYDNAVSVLRQAGSAVSNFFTNTIPQWQDALSEALAKGYRNTLSAFRQAGSAVSNFFTDTIPQWRDALSGAVAKGYENTVSTLRQVRARVGNFLTNTWDAFSGVVGTGYGNTVSALRQVGAAVSSFFTNTIPQWWNAFFGALTTGYGNTVSALRQVRARVGSFFTNTIPEWWDVFSGALVKGYRNTVSAFRQGGTAVSNFFTNTLPQWLDALSGAVATGFANTVFTLRQVGARVGNFFVNAWDVFSGALATGYGSTVSALRRAGTAVGNFFTSTIPQWWDALSGVVATGYGNTVSALRQGSTAVSSFFTDTIPQWRDSLSEALATGYENMVSALRQVKAKVGNFLTNTWDVFSGALATGYGSTVSALRQVRARVGSFFTNTWNAFSGALAAGYGNMLSVFRQGGAAVANFFTNTIPQWRDSLSGAAARGYENTLSALRQVKAKVGNFLTDTWDVLSKALATGYGNTVSALRQGAVAVNSFLTNTWDVFSGTLATGYGNAVSAFRQAGTSVANFFTNTIPQWWDALSEAFATGYGNTVSALRQGGAAVSDFFTDTIPQWWGELSEALATGFATGYENTVSALRQVKARVGSFFTNTWNAFSGALAAGYVNTVSAFRQGDAAVSNFFTNTLPQWWDALSAVVGTGYGNTVSALRQVGAGVRNVFVNTWDALATGFRNTVSALRQGGAAVGNFFTNTIPQWWDALSGVVGTGLRNTVSVFRQGGVAVGNFLINTKDVFFGTLAAGYRSTVSALRQAGTAVGSFFTNTIPEWWDVFSGVLATGYGNTVSALRQAGSAVSNFFTNIIPQWWGALSGAVARGYENTVSTLRQVRAGVGNFLTNTWDALSGALAAGFGNTVSALRQGGASVGNFFTNTIPQWWGVFSEAAAIGFGNTVSAFRQGSAIVGNFFTNTIPQWLNALSGGVATGFENAISTLRQGGVAVGNVLANTWDALSRVVATGYGNTVSALRQARGSVGNFFTNTLPQWWDALSGAVATGFENAISTLRQGGVAVGNFFTNTLPQWWGALSGVLAIGFGNTVSAFRQGGAAVGNFFTNTLPQWGSALSEVLATGFGNTVSAFRQAGATVGSFLTNTWDVFSGALATGFGNTVSALRQGGAVVGSFFTNTLPQWWGAVSGVVGTGLRNTVSALRQGSAAVSNFFTNTLPQWGSALSGALTTGLRNKVSALRQGGAAVGNFFTNTLPQWGSALSGALATGFGNTISVFRQGGAAVGNFFTNTLPQWWGVLSGVLVTGFRNTVSAFRQGVAAVGGFLTNTWDALSGALATGFRNTVSAFRQGGAAVGSFFTNTLPQLLGVVSGAFATGFGNTISVFRQGGAAVGNFFTNTLPQWWGVLSGVLVTGLRNTVSAFRQGVAAVGDFLTNTWDALSVALATGYGNTVSAFRQGGAAVAKFFTDTLPQWWDVLSGVVRTGLRNTVSALRQGGAAVSNFFTNTIPQWWGALSGVAGTGFRNTVSAFRQGVAAVGGFLTNTWDVLSGALAAGFKNTVSALRQGGTAVGNFFTNTLPQWWDALSTVVGTGFGNTVSAFRQGGVAVNNFFTNTIPQWWDTLSGVLATGVRNTVLAFRQAGTTVGNFLTNTWDLLSYVVGTGFRNTVSAFRQGGAAVGNFFTNTLPQWWGAVSRVFATGFGNTVSALRQGGAAVGNFFTNTIPQWWDALSGAVGTGLRNTVSALRQAKAKVGNFFTNTWDVLSGAFATGLINTGSALRQGGVAVGNFFTNTLPQWGSVVSGAFATGLKNTGSVLRQGGAVVGSFFTDTLPQLWGVVSGAFATGLRNTGSALRQGGVAVGNFFTNTLPQWWGVVSGALATGLRNTISVLRQGGAAVGSFFTDTLPQWGSAFSGAFATGLRNTVSALRQGGAAVGSFFTNTLPQWWGVVSGAFATGLRNTISVLRQGGAAVGSFFTNTLPQWGSALFRALRSGVGAVGEGLGRVVSLGRSAISGISSFTNWLKEQEDPIDAILVSLQNQWSRVHSGRTQMSDVFEYFHQVSRSGRQAFRMMSRPEGFSLVRDLLNTAFGETYTRRLLGTQRASAFQALTILYEYSSTVLSKLSPELLPAFKEYAKAYTAFQPVLAQSLVFALSKPGVDSNTLMATLAIMTDRETLAALRRGTSINEIVRDKLRRDEFLAPTRTEDYRNIISAFDRVVSPWKDSPIFSFLGKSKTLAKIGSTLWGLLRQVIAPQAVRVERAMQEHSASAKRWVARHFDEITRKGSEVPVANLQAKVTIPEPPAPVRTEDMSLPQPVLLDFKDNDIDEGDLVLYSPGHNKERRKKIILMSMQRKAAKGINVRAVGKRKVKGKGRGGAPGSSSFSGFSRNTTTQTKNTTKQTPKKVIPDPVRVPPPPPPPKHPDLFPQPVKDLLNQFGKAYVVGGAVRDALLGNEPKDLDIEVYGKSLDTVIKIAKSIGEVDLVGKSFGVIKLKHPTLGIIDITLPRKEIPTGAGHKDFDVSIDPDLSIKKATERRDFTINTIMWGTGGIVDPHGGMADLEKKVLKHVSERFVEDPLRVLRAFQFASRYNLVVHKSTVDLSRRLVSKFPTISEERLYAEWEKWSLGIAPEAGLDFLIKSGWAEPFGLKEASVTEIAKLGKTLKDAKPEDKTIVLLAALSRYNPNLVDVIKAPKQIASQVKALSQVIDQKPPATQAEVNLLSVALNPASMRQYLLLLEALNPKAASVVRGFAKEVMDKPPKPLITGSDLIRLGIPQGSVYKEILQDTYHAQLMGLFLTKQAGVDWVKSKYGNLIGKTQRASQPSSTSSAVNVSASQTPLAAPPPPAIQPVTPVAQKVTQSKPSSQQSPLTPGGVTSSLPKPIPLLPPAGGPKIDDYRRIMQNRSVLPSSGRTIITPPPPVETQRLTPGGITSSLPKPIPLLPPAGRPKIDTYRLTLDSRSVLPSSGRTIVTPPPPIETEHLTPGGVTSSLPKPIPLLPPAGGPKIDDYRRIMQNRSVLPSSGRTIITPPPTTPKVSVTPQQGGSAGTPPPTTPKVPLTPQQGGSAGTPPPAKGGEDEQRVLSVIHELFKVFTITRYEQAGFSPTQTIFGSKENVPIEFQNLFLRGMSDFQNLGIDEEQLSEYATVFSVLSGVRSYAMREQGEFLPRSTLALPMVVDGAPGQMLQVLESHGLASYHSDILGTRGDLRTRMEVYDLVRGALPGEALGLSSRMQSIIAYEAITDQDLLDFPYLLTDGDPEDLQAIQYRQLFGVDPSPTEPPDPLRTVSRVVAESIVWYFDQYDKGNHTLPHFSEILTRSDKQEFLDMFPELKKAPIKETRRLFYIIPGFSDQLSEMFGLTEEKYKELTSKALTEKKKIERLSNWLANRLESSKSHAYRLLRTQLQRGTAEDYIIGLKALDEAGLLGEAAHTRHLFLPVFTHVQDSEGGYRVMFHPEGKEHYTHGVLLGYDVLKPLSMSFRGYVDDVLKVQNEIIRMGLEVIAPVMGKIQSGIRLTGEEVESLYYYKQLIQQSNQAPLKLLERRLAGQALGDRITSEGGVAVAVSSWALGPHEGIFGSRAFNTVEKSEVKHIYSDLIKSLNKLKGISASKLTAKIDEVLEPFLPLFTADQQQELKQLATQRITAQDAATRRQANTQMRALFVRAITETEEIATVARSGAPLGAAGEALQANWMRMLGVSNKQVKGLQLSADTQELSLTVARSSTLLMLPSASVLHTMLGDFDGDTFQFVSTKLGRYGNLLKQEFSRYKKLIKELRQTEAQLAHYQASSTASTPGIDYFKERIQELQQKVDTQRLVLQQAQRQYMELVRRKQEKEQVGLETFRRSVAAMMGFGADFGNLFTPGEMAQMLTQARSVTDRMQGGAEVVSRMQRWENLKSLDATHGDQLDTVDPVTAIELRSLRYFAQQIGKSVQDLTDAELIEYHTTRYQAEQFVLDLNKNADKMLGTVMDTGSFEALQATIGHLGTQLIGQTYNTILPMAGRMFALGSLLNLQQGHPGFNQLLSRVQQNVAARLGPEVAERFNPERIWEQFHAIQGFLQNMQQSIRDSLKAKDALGMGLLADEELQNRLLDIERELQSAPEKFYERSGLSASDIADKRRLEAVRDFVYRKVGESITPNDPGAHQLTMFASYLELAELVSSETLAGTDFYEKFINQRANFSGWFSRTDNAKTRMERYMEFRRLNPDGTPYDFMYHEIVTNLNQARTEFIYQNISGGEGENIFVQRMEQLAQMSGSIDFISQEMLDAYQRTQGSQKEKVKAAIHASVQATNPLTPEMFQILHEMKGLTQAGGETKDVEDKLQPKHPNPDFYRQSVAQAMRMNKIQGAENQLAVGIHMLDMVGEIYDQVQHEDPSLTGRALVEEVRDRIISGDLIESLGMGGTAAEKEVWAELLAEMYVETPDGDDRTYAEIMYQENLMMRAHREFYEAYLQMLESGDYTPEDIAAVQGYTEQQINKIRAQRGKELRRLSQQPTNWASYLEVALQELNSLTDITRPVGASNRNNSILLPDPRLEWVEIGLTPIIVGALTGGIKFDERIAMTGLDILQSMAQSSIASGTLAREFVGKINAEREAQIAAETAQRFRIRNMIDQNGLIVGAFQGIGQEMIYRAANQLAYTAVDAVLPKGAAPIPGLKGVGIIASEILAGMLAMSATRAISRATGAQDQFAEYDRVSEILSYMGQAVADTIQDILEPPSGEEPDFDPVELEFLSLTTTDEIELGTQVLETEDSIDDTSVIASEFA